MARSPLSMPPLLCSLRQFTVAKSFQKSISLGFYTFKLLTSLLFLWSYQKFLALVVKWSMFSTTESHIFASRATVRRLVTFPKFNLNFLWLDWTENPCLYISLILELLQLQIGYYAFLLFFSSFSWPPGTIFTTMYDLQACPSQQLRYSYVLGFSISRQQWITADRNLLLYNSYFL